jgi:hypothetical protein
MSTKKTISNTFTVNTVIDGDDAAIAFATPSQISIPCYYTGYVKSQKITGVTFSLKVGTNAAGVTSVTSGTKPTGVTVTGVAANAVTITVGTSATASGLSAGVTFTVNGSYSGKAYSANVTVALIGASQGDVGERGKVGRFFYYAGEWNDFASTDSFLVNDAQAPYFYYNNNYWVFNPETNGTYTKQNMGTPSSSSSSWKLMTDDFKYIITEAIFGNYAHFGSAIINGDWMLSTNGTINGVAYNNGSDYTYNGVTKPAYTWFDASNPNTNTGHNFIPNYCVDLLTGKSYQNDAYLKGLIYATGGTITGDMNITGSLTIGTYGANQNSIVLSPSSTNPSIVGYVGTTEVFRIGTQVNYDGRTLPTIKIGNGYLRGDALLLYDSAGSNFRAYTTRFIVERVANSLHYPFSIDVNTNKKVVLKANGKDMWPTSKSEVGYGGVYVDGTTLRVNMDG